MVLQWPTNWNFVTGYILQCRTLTATRWRPFTPVQWHSDDGQQWFLTWHWYCYFVTGYILQCRTLTGTRWRPFTSVRWRAATIPYMTLILLFFTGYILQCRTLTPTRWRPFTSVQWHSDDGQQRFLTWHWYCYFLQGIYFSVEHSPGPDDDLSLLSNDIPMMGSNDSLHDIVILL